jgi:hypothetical protein
MKHIGRFIIFFAVTALAFAAASDALGVVPVYSSIHADTWTEYKVRDVHVDDQDNVYVAIVNSPTSETNDPVIIKYNPDFTLAWKVTYDDNYGSSYPGVYQDTKCRIASIDPFKVATDQNGNVFFGCTNFLDDSTFIMKLDSNGDLLWTASYPKFYIARFSDLVVDTQGNVYATLWDTISNFNFGYITLKYSPDGMLLWYKPYDPPGSWAEAYRITLDAVGNVYVTGDSDNGGIAVVSYTPDGVQRWDALYSAGERPGDITVDE